MKKNKNKKCLVIAMPTGKYTFYELMFYPSRELGAVRKYRWDKNFDSYELLGLWNIKK